MSALLWILFFVATGTALAYRKASIGQSTAVVAAALLVFSLFSAAAIGWKLLLWAVFAGVAAVLNIDELRRTLISGPAFKFFKGVLPEMSDTERTALDAGTTWFEADLFSGRPNWHKWLAIPKPRLSAEEQAFMDGPVEELCGMFNEWEITHEKADLNEATWDFIKKNKFFGMIIPKAYGGLEFSAYAHSTILAKVASAGGVTANSIVAVPNSLGPAELLLHYGTDEQKNHYLPRLAVGEEIPCFGLTSPLAGSDAGAIPDRGVICKGKFGGKTVLGMKLTFDKRYITLAPVATVIGLAFKLYDPDGLLGDTEDLGITCALIPRDTKGVEIGRRHFPVNAPFQNGPIKGTDVFVPLDYIIGGPAMAGQGWRMLMECLSIGRSISLPSGACGGSLQGAYATGAYAKVRKQFNVSIGEFEGIQEAMGRIGARAYMSNAVRMQTAFAVDLGERPSVPSAIAKMHVTDLAQKISIDAMDVHGGKAVCLGPRNLIGRGYQGAPVGTTVEGANILTRSMMIFGQGAIRCHPYVLQEMEAVADDNTQRGLENFDAAFMGHIGHVASAKARSLVLGLTGARLASSPVDGSTAIHYKRLARYSANLAFLSDIAMASLGGSLKFRESISARLGDVLSGLYFGACVLKVHEQDGRPVEDLPLIDWALADIAATIEDRLDGVIRELPVPGLLLRPVIFPLGRRAKPPADALNAAITKIHRTPGAQRDRLAGPIYKPTQLDHPMGVLNQALEQVIEHEALELRMLKAYKAGQLKHPHPRARIDEALDAKLIDKSEHAKLVELYDLVTEVIAVDDFSDEDLQAGAPAKPAGRKAPAKKPAARKSSASPSRRKAPARKPAAKSAGKKAASTRKRAPAKKKAADTEPAE